MEHLGLAEIQEAEAVGYQLQAHLTKTLSRRHLGRSSMAGIVDNSSCWEICCGNRRGLGLCYSALAIWVSGSRSWDSVQKCLQGILSCQIPLAVGSPSDSPERQLRKTIQTPAEGQTRLEEGNDH